MARGRYRLTTSLSARGQTTKLGGLHSLANMHESELHHDLSLSTVDVTDVLTRKATGILYAWSGPATTSQDCEGVNAWNLCGNVWSVAQELWKSVRQ